MTDIQELAERLLTHPYSTTGLPQIARIVTDNLPDGLPIELPIPLGGVLLGSLARVSDQQLASADIIVDAPGDTEQIDSFYEQNFLANGWTAPPIGLGPMRGGFMPMAGPTSSRTFCRGASGPWLSVTLRALANGKQEVRIHVDLTSAGPCAGGGPRSIPVGMQMLPALSAPPGVPLEPGGGGGSTDAWWSEATAHTEAL